jgi:lysylphosphatidylglycerol synthetase-like protein (DUF2156 family)
MVNDGISWEQLKEAFLKPFYYAAVWLVLAVRCAEAKIGARRVKLTLYGLVALICAVNVYYIIILFIYSGIYIIHPYAPVKVLGLSLAALAAFGLYMLALLWKRLLEWW